MKGGGQRIYFGIYLSITLQKQLLYNFFLTEKFIKNFLFLTSMIEKKPFSEILGKLVVTKEGKRLGIVKDITFETRVGELIQLVLKDPTPYIKNLNLEITKEKEVLIPYSAIIAVGDFVVVSEEDLI
jgi:sporulation protein YlmC with PRC-barrel domain